MSIRNSRYNKFIYWKVIPLAEHRLLHRGTEKLMECNYYNSNIGYFDRLDHVPGVIQELLFILILERIMHNILVILLLSILLNQKL